MDTSALVLRLDASVWLGVGVLGVLVFLVGIYIPAIAGIPYADLVRDGVAVAGGAVAVFGFSLFADRRTYDRTHPRRGVPRGRNRELAIAPSLEVYDPRREDPKPPPTS